MTRENVKEARNSDQMESRADGARHFLTSNQPLKPSGTGSSTYTEEASVQQNRMSCQRITKKKKNVLTSIRKS